MQNMSREKKKKNKTKQKAAAISLRFLHHFSRDFIMQTSSPNPDFNYQLSTKSNPRFKCTNKVMKPTCKLLPNGTLN